jgi:hypothetical protein
MISVEQFKELCRTKPAEDIVDELFLSRDAAHVSIENQAHLIGGLASTFGIDKTSIQLWIYFKRARFAVFRKVETAGLAMSVDLLYSAYGYVPDSPR